MAYELAKRVAAQIVGGEKAVAPAADHGLAVWREGEGVMGVAGSLAALDGGEDLAVFHHVEQVEIAELAARTCLQAQASSLGHRPGEVIGTSTECLWLAERAVLCRQFQAEGEVAKLAAFRPLDAPGDRASVRRKPNRPDGAADADERAGQLAA